MIRDLRPLSCSLKGSRGLRNPGNTGLCTSSQTWLCTTPLGVGLNPILLTNSIPRFWNRWPSLEAVAGVAGFRASNGSLFARPSLLCHPCCKWWSLGQGKEPSGSPGLCIKASLANKAPRPELLTLWLQGGRLTSLMPGVCEMLSNYFLNKWM